MPLSSGLLPPSKRGLLVLGNAAAQVIGISQLILRICIALPGRFQEPLHRLFAILLKAKSCRVGLAKTVLSLSMPLICGHAPVPDGLLIILCDTVAGMIRTAKKKQVISIRLIVLIRIHIMRLRLVILRHPALRNRSV